MNRVSGKVHLVGSVPFDTAEGVFRACAEGVGDVVSCLPDGEVGFRIEWINFLAAKLYSEHPSLVTISRPNDVDGEPGWVPTGYDDHWFFEAKPDLEVIRFETLGYAEEAISSFATFKLLRDEGVIPADVRFLVSLPMSESATRWFVKSARNYRIMSAAYEEAMGREIAQIQNNIPADDLVIQWDVCMEVLSVDTNDQKEGLSEWEPPGEPMDRYLRVVKLLSSYVDDNVPMGIHLCYGDLLHRHLVEPQDLEVLVRMANASIADIDRVVDFVHMPVPRNRSDDAYFAPLSDLQIGDAKLYLGLVHYTDGVAGGLKRLEVAKKHASGFGISTECGFRRRSKGTVTQLLDIHHEIANALV